jgi:hypothetical protein
VSGLFDPSAVPAPSGAAEALALIEAGLDFLNGADLPDLPVTTLAESLQTWSRLTAKRAAAEACLVGAFDAVDGASADAQSSTSAWLAFFTRSTAPASRGILAGARRLRRHPQVAKALAGGSISESYGRWICDSVAKFEPQDREEVEKILVDAAIGGALLEDLLALVVRMYRLLCPNGQERDEERINAERRVTLGKTFGGAGRLNGDLTAHATALTETVIESLAVKRGPEDNRTKPQRRHDALMEAFQRLVDSDLLPARGGAKPQVKVEMNLADLRSLPGGPQAEADWIRAKAAELARGRLAGRTAEELLGAQSCDDGTQAPLLAGVGAISAGLAGALGCDSLLAPTVVGSVGRDALAAMTDQWARDHGLAGRGDCTAGAGCGCDCHHPMSPETHQRLQESMLRWAVEVLSGPGGLASYLRTGILDRPLSGPSIVLDAGEDARTVPAGLERTVRRRDGRCRWPGCEHPAELSQVHHILPRSEGGPTTLSNLLVLCLFHHVIAVHSWGWTVTLNPDGTVTAAAPDGRVLHDQGPPATGPPLWAA